MNCHEIESILNEHAIRVLSAAERADADLHLAKCERCADAWLVHETLVNESPAAPRAGLFAETAARVLANAHSPATRRPRHGFGRSLGLAAAALVAAVALMSLQWRGDNSEVVSDSPTGVAEQRPRPTGMDERAPLSGGASELRVPAGPASRFLAGRHFERLPVPVPTASTPGRVEVCEFFMFGCVHCYALEPYLERWNEAKPGHVDLVRVPAMFNATARLHAQAFYTAEALGKAEELGMHFYEEIHVRGNPLDTAASIETFFGRFGIDARSFRDAFSSFAVYTKVERAEELNRQYRVSSTPSIAVNGKYLTNTAMAGSYETLFAIVDDLVEAESSEACREQDPSRCPL